ncbi:SGNH hydrolase-type esterase domain-containing protein [Dactylonectria macrodidyma]|uniref:SGNH hydrolase-type esterase domain-containing protein n=1 Tax=Dactylonectria macrodidyma TaxID=307937 RepID=A0A9P9JJK2_9HYPO|nr:SGNH hydrolase-type esterase domain-containing protein [Dactylonectria macrodidyma]
MRENAMSDNSLNILCFGDSLTQGFHNYGLGESPYSETLEERLNAEFPDREIRIRTSGVPGDVASSSSFQRRFNQEVNAVPYDWVIILGGTNDLGRLLSVEKVFDALKSYWNTAIMNGSKVLALTVPECQAKPEWLEINRHGLNQQILFHSQPNFYTFDLYSHIPYHSLTEAERTLYWDDGLHLTADGYAWMGEHIANGLIQILKKEDM